MPKYQIGKQNAVPVIFTICNIDNEALVFDHFDILT